MKVTREERPQREVLLNIELEPQDLEKHLERSYRKVVQRANIPGFRKGKAPRRIVEQFLGREYLLNEALDFLIPESARQAVESEELDMVGQPKIELEGLDPVTLKATVALRPEVDLGDYRGTRIPQESVEVTEEQVNGVLEQLRYDLAPWEPVERPVQYGDQVNLDVQGWAEKKQIANNQGVDYIPREDGQAPVPGFAEALQGMRPGETREFTLTPSQDHNDPELAGKTCLFTVRANEVKAKHLPEVDNEFAKGVGEGFDSLEALRQRVNEDLTQEAERTARQRYEEQVMDQLMQGATVEMAPLLVDHEIDHLVREQEDALRQRRVSLEQYLQVSGKSTEQLRQELQPIAEKRIKRPLALRKVAEEEGIEAADEDVQAEIDSMVQESGERGDSVRSMFDSDAGRDSWRQVVLTRKTTQRLVDIASGKLTDGGSSEEEPEKASEEVPVGSVVEPGKAPPDPEPHDKGGSKHG